MLDQGRRNFIALLGGVAAFGTRAAVGDVSQSTPEAGAALVAAVRRGLSKVGIVEGRDVTSEMRCARYDVDRLSGLEMK
jgi:hypothetical protein